MDDNFTWGLDELNDLWDSINNSRTDLFFYWISILSLTFSLLGSISNLMSVIVLLKLSSQLSTFVYLTSLSISDMITCLSVMIMQILEYLVQTRRNTTITIAIRHTEILFGAIAAGSRVLSFWISTFVTMDRWILVCYPMYGKRFCTIQRARILCRILFSIAFLYTIPLCFEYEVISIPSLHQIMDLNNQTMQINNDKLQKSSFLITKGYSDLARRKAYRWFYLFFNGIFVYILPTLTIVFFNIQLISVLHRLKSRAKRLSQKNHFRQTNRHRRHFHHSKYSVTISVIIMVLVLLLCRSPTVVLWILWSFEFSIKIFFDSSFSPIVRRFHQLANLIAIVNAATNFLPFCVFGQLFRSECLIIYCCKKPTSEELAKQARRKYRQKYQHSKRNSKTRLMISDPQTTQTGSHLLHTIPSYTSDSTTGMTPSSNDQVIPTNILRLSDPPNTLNGNIPPKNETFEL